jgi:hypothetical protein
MSFFSDDIGTIATLMKAGVVPCLKVRTAYLHVDGSHDNTIRNRLKYKTLNKERMNLS